MVNATLIIDCKAELLQFKRAVCQLDMPTVDIEAAVGQIFYAVFSEHTARFSTMELATDMAQSDALFENHDLDNGQQKRIYNAVVHFCDSIIQKLQHFGAYDHNGCFPYDSRKILNDGSIILQRTHDYP